MRKVLVAALCAASGLFAPVASAGSAAQTMTFEVIRTTSGSSHFDLWITASPGERGALIGEAEAYVRAGRVTRVDGGAIVSNEPRAQGLDAGNLHIRTCGYTGTCNPGQYAAALLGVTYASSASSAGDINALYVVVRAANISVKFKGAGWALRKQPLAFRNQATRQSATASVSDAGSGVAVTEGARATGGDEGSLAVAVPPCSISQENVVARGVGQMTLTGGVTTPRYTCPAAIKPPIMASYARTSTTWQLTGWAAGDTTLADQALLVIDEPRSTPGTAR
jgi:hypothetical protein